MWARGLRGRITPGASRRIQKSELPPAPTEEFDGDDVALEEEIERLTESNRSDPESERERMLLHLRNLLAIRRLDNGVVDLGHPEPDGSGLPEGPLVEIGPADLTPAVLRGGILSRGCVLVRGLVPRQDAELLAKEIDRCFVERARHDADRSFDQRYYVPFEHDPRRGVRLLREWIKEGGGVLAVDSPMISFQLGEALGEAGLPEVVEGYLGSPPLISGDKTTLRKAEPTVSGAWHQDGKFMGHVRALNLWLSLSDCGRDAPGLDLVPRRLDDHVPTNTDDAMMLNQVSQRTAEAAAGELPIMRPIFEPGDALLFDELFLHKTASDPSMRRPRYAVESWFFSPAGFPADYVPLTV
jgi:hypothetical protein